MCPSAGYAYLVAQCGVDVEGLFPEVIQHLGEGLLLLPVASHRGAVQARLCLATRLVGRPCALSWMAFWRVAGSSLRLPWPKHFFSTENRKRTSPVAHFMRKWASCTQNDHKCSRIAHNVASFAAAISLSSWLSVLWSRGPRRGFAIGCVVFNAEKSRHVRPPGIVRGLQTPEVDAGHPQVTVI